MSSFIPGSLVRLRFSRTYAMVGMKHILDDYDGKLALVIKRVGKDPNDHEYFEVLVNDQMLHAWDDELEKRD